MTLDNLYQAPRHHKPLSGPYDLYSSGIHIIKQSSSEWSFILNLHPLRFSQSFCCLFARWTGKGRVVREGEERGEGGGEGGLGSYKMTYNT